MLPRVTRRSLLRVAAAAGSIAQALPRPVTAAVQPAADSRAAVRTLRSDTVIKADDGRDVRISRWPAWGTRRGVILFSHGALSAPEKYERVLGPWNAAGFEVMAPLHVDSTDHPDHAKYGMLDSWRARLLDMRALARVADVPRYVAAGHSYGGLVALTLGGVAAEVPPGVTGTLRDPQVSAVVAMSPPGAAPGLVTLDGYATLAVPAFIQTGDLDLPPGPAGGHWQTHLAAYDAAPAGDKYALVLEGVDHYFGGLICKFDLPGPTQDSQLTVAVAAAALFMDAFALHDAMARSLLDQTLTLSAPAKLSRK